MGAEFFQINYGGKTLNEAYNDAKENAIFEYGTDPYNGTIATTYGVIDKTKEYKNSGKSLQEYIEMYIDKGEKRQCYAICLEEPKLNTNKIKTQVEHIVEKGTKKWILKYVVYDFDNQLGSYNTKGDAVKAARAHTEKTQKRTTVSMEKRLEKGNTTVAKITYKTSSNEKYGRWVLFGWAAC